MMKKTVLILMFLIAAFSLKAQPYSKGQVFTLDQCISLAENNNTDVLLANARMDASRGDLTAAFGEFLPSVDFNMGYTRQLDAEGASFVEVGNTIIPLAAQNPNSYRMNASASYTIFDGFSRDATYNRAKNNFDAYYESSQFTKKRVVLNVYRQFVDVQRNSQILNIRRENLEVGKKELERINALYKAGSRPIASVYVQEADLGSRELEVVRAENALDQSKAQLLITMGLNPDQPAEFADESLPDTIIDNEATQFRADVGSMPSAVSQARNNRLDYAIATLNINSANSSMTIAESSYYPRIYLSGGWSWANTEFYNFGPNGNTFLSVGFQIPIFDQFATNRNVQSAKLQLEQRQLEQMQAEQNIRSDVQTSFLNLQSAEKQAEIADRSLRSAQKSFEAMSEMYRLGSVGFNDYLTANNQLVTARIDRINAIYSYFLAKKEVLFAIGKL